LGIGLTVLSDDPDFVKAINAILDQEITRALRRSATQPEAARAGRLAKSLKANRAGFALAIEYRAPEAEMQLPEKGDFTLTLSVPRQPEPEMANRRVVRIAEAEADRIIDYLAAEEAFLGKANDVMGKGIGGGPRPGCTWLVWGANGPMLHQPERSHPMLLRESVPAGPMMLARLDGLRIVLDGEAAKAMDQLLERIGPHRKEWEKAQPTVE